MLGGSTLPDRPDHRSAMEHAACTRRPQDGPPVEIA